ncbi:MAG TPA: ATP-binding protein [Casimicrobiaceae bacterium]|nr:ATP-binding protein [Casimicrobiaceae bacterium]
MSSADPSHGPRARSARSAAPRTSSLKFLLDLDRVLATLVEGDSVTATAVSLLARHLGADACAFDEIDASTPAVNDATQGRKAGVARLTIPVRRGERVAAVMTLDRRGRRKWQLEEIDLARLVAHRCEQSLERARAVREARESADQVRLVADHVPAKISYVDCDLRYRFNNAAYADWYGVGVAEIVGRYVRDVLGDATFEERLPYMLRALAGETVTFESRSEHRRLGMRMTDITCVPDVDDAGNVRGFFVMGVDTTERQRAEAQLRESDRRKDEFLAMLAHELRNPLAPLANALYLWPIVRNDEEKTTELREMMERQVRQLTRLIDDLLDVSRISRGKIQLRRSSISLRDVLRDAIDGVRAQVEQHRQTLACVVDDASELTLDGDAARLVQVFGNLLNNASKYTHDGGTIRVSATRDGGEAVVSVTDNGRGIPPHMLDRVFEMFVQVDPTLESHAGGLGIGLALSRRLVDLHGGRIEARSAGRGHGTEVIVRLPLTGERVAAVAANEPLAVSRRILVVDDAKPPDRSVQ